LNKLSRDAKVKIRSELIKNVLNTGYNKENKKYIQVYWPLFSDHINVHLPLGFITCNSEFIPDSFEIKTNPDYTLNDVVLRPEQQSFLKRVLKPNPTQHIAQAWELEPAFGKTITCVAAIAFYQVDTVIVVHRRDLKSQWITSIKSALKNVEFETKVVMISEIKKITKCDLLVIDEAHVCITPKSAELLAILHPKIIIGLSGTFYRHDHNNVYLEWLFGPKIGLEQDEINIMKETTSRCIEVEIIHTNIVPKVQHSSNGKVDWNHILVQLSRNDLRNNMIVETVKKHSHLNILILVKFVEHGMVLHDQLESSVTYFGKDKLTKVVCDAPIIISTAQKVGTGISLNKLNCLIFATDFVNYSIQYISRVLRDKNQDAKIIDFVDDYSILKYHAKKRRQVYNDLNATIRVFF
jgi:superfamily II DNA or RNA helicase